MRAYTRPPQDLDSEFFATSSGSHTFSRESRRSAERLGMGMQKVVMVVEDEWLIRAEAVDFIANNGFDVVEARNSDEALELLHLHDGLIHILFTDVHMPGTMSGLELARHTRMHWPHISILIVSGQAHLLDADLPSQSRFLSKPYQDHDLLTHLRELAAVA